MKPRFEGWTSVLIERGVSLFVLLALAVPAWAENSEQAAPAVASGTQLINVVFSLLLIIGVILALAWLLRRFGQGGFSNQQHMKVLATLPLGTRERLLVVDVSGQQLLLGVTPQQIRTLHVFETPVIDTTQATPSTDFKNKLMSIMHNKASGK